MADLEYLEYEEESEGDGLFGSDNEDLPAAFAVRDTRAPIVANDAVAADPGSKEKHGERTPPPTYPTAISKTDKSDSTSDQRVTPDQRMIQLRRQRATIPPPPAVGVPSLKIYCSLAVRANSMRIYDIGGLEYSLLEEFLCNCPREQLAEIEKSSPHITKDTDWLWEYFVIAEYPLYYESCRLRKGQPRVNGWRRMYEKGAEDAAERRTQARERVANRYRQLEEERASKRIVVMDTLVAPKANKWGRATGAHSLSTARRGASASAGYSQQNKMQTAMNKARNDSNRARVALTHASGKFTPPAASVARRRPAPDTSSLYSNPYTAPGSSTPGFTTGPRLPPPRTARPKNAFPDAYPSSEVPPPTSRAPRAPPAPFPAGPPVPVAVSRDDRFRIDPNAGREMRTIHKPKVENYATRKVLDFFESSSSTAAPSSPMKRTASASASNGSDTKRPRAEGSGSLPQSPERDNTSTSQDKRRQPSSLPPSRPHTPARPLPPPKSAKELESVLFLKKKRPAPRR